MKNCTEVYLSSSSSCFSSHPSSGSLFAFNWLFLRLWYHQPFWRGQSRMGTAVHTCFGGLISHPPEHPWGCSSLQCFALGYHSCQSGVSSVMEHSKSPDFQIKCLLSISLLTLMLQEKGFQWMTITCGRYWRVSGTPLIWMAKLRSSWGWSTDGVPVQDLHHEFKNSGST